MPMVVESACVCGEKINIETDCPHASRKDGKRPHYPDDKDEVYGGKAYPASHITVFRCRACSEWVGDSVPGAEFV